jgi:HD-GYP domain-containing protein (c-di-GMP phosphodiesterase class II)
MQAVSRRHPPRPGVPLTYKLLFVLVTAGFASSALVAHFSAQHAAAERSQVAHLQAQQVATSIAHRAGSLLENDDRVRLGVLAAAAADFAGSSAYRVLILDQQGVVRLDTGLALDGSRLALQTADGATRRQDESGRFEVLVPIVATGGGGGEVRLRYADPRVASSFPWTMFGVAFLASLSLVGLACAFVHHWLQRVHRLQLMARRLARGDSLDAAADPRFGVDAAAGPAVLEDLHEALYDLEHMVLTGSERTEKGFLELVDHVVRSLEQRGFAAPGHGDRCVRLVGPLADRLDLPAPARHALDVAARYHEVGKIGVRPSVFGKSGPLSDVERDSLRQHPLRGGRLLATLPSLAEAGETVRHLYEKYDGTGSPEGLRGDRIPLASRILAIVVAYDQLTCREIDGSRLAWDEALELLRQDAGERFDPELLDVFEDCLRVEHAGEAERPRRAGGLRGVRIPGPEGAAMPYRDHERDVVETEELLDEDAILAWGEAELEVLADDELESGEENED